MRYHNYHKHTHFSNLRLIDSITKPEEYLTRMEELGTNIYFTTEHGFQGSVFETLNMLEKYNKDKEKEKKIRMAVGVEAYYVDDVQSKDKGYHLVIIALNNKGVEEINTIISLANLNGFYYKPRIDRKMLEENVNPKNVIITSACVGGICNLRNPKREEMVCWFFNRFKSNFYLEIQNHKDAVQVMHNLEIKRLSNLYGIELIHANDSHYIYPEDSKYREMFIRAKDQKVYEDTFILDYPDTETIFERYEEQGVFNKDEVTKALENTLVFDNCEEITLYNTDIKMPYVSDNPNKELKEILNNEWKNKKNEFDLSIKEEYFKAIREEVDIVEKTSTSAYFVLNYKICKEARENGCIISQGGRGSAGSFFINNPLGFLGLDRLKSPITLYPTRFMSVARILQSKSLPDIDFNTSNQELMIEATEKILGKEKCCWLVAFKPLQESSAFRLWCKGSGYSFKDYNDVAKELDAHRNDKKWKNIIEDSKRFVGVIESISPSPCSMLLSPYDVASHIGLIKTKDRMCCILDSYNCDKWKYLKNDYLKVTVWNIIDETCKLAGIEVPTINELLEKVDEKTWNIYSEGLTCTINQVDSDYGTGLVKEYKPKNIVELSAFVAAIRPGFRSLLNNFIKREPYSTNVKELDDLLEDSFSYLLYQESIMKYLIWLGIDESETYTIIKKISKKKFTEDELEELKKKLYKGWIEVVGKEDMFMETWQVVEDASNYSFNASHSLAYAYDSLYGAYLKANYPYEYYTVVFELYKNDIKRTAKLTKELEYFGINLEKVKYGYSKSNCFYDKNTQSIYKGLNAVKFISEGAGDYLWEKSQEGLDFIELLYDNSYHDKKLLNSRQINVLIKLGFFSEFGSVPYLKKLFEIFTKYGKVKTLKKDSLDFPVSIAKMVAGKETAKQFSEIDNKELISLLARRIPYLKTDMFEMFSSEHFYTGSITPNKNIEENLFVINDLLEKKSYYIVDTINLQNGESYIYRIDTGYGRDLKKSDILKLGTVRRTPKVMFINGSFVESNSEYNYYIEEYEKVYSNQN